MGCTFGSSRHINIQLDLINITGINRHHSSVTKVTSGLYHWLFKAYKGVKYTDGCD